jgi:hypothetical protein
MYQHILVLIPGLVAIVYVNRPSWHAVALISVKVWNNPDNRNSGNRWKTRSSFETVWNVVIVVLFRGTVNTKRTENPKIWESRYLIIFGESPRVTELFLMRVTGVGDFFFHLFFVEESLKEEGREKECPKWWPSGCRILLSKTYVLINRVSPWDPMVREAHHTPVCLQVGTQIPCLFTVRVLL